MKILNLVGGCSTDGASLGAINMHNYLLSVGCDSEIYFQDQRNFKVNQVRNSINKISKFSRLKRRVYNFLDSLILKVYVSRRRYIFSPGIIGYKFNDIDFEKYDLLVIHWPGNGFLDLKKLEKLNIKIFWVARDYWITTAGCHIPYDCNEYINNCQNCIYLKKNKGKSVLSSFLKTRKDNIISKLNMSVLLISEGMLEKFQSFNSKHQGVVSTMGNFLELRYSEEIFNNIEEFKSAFREKHNLDKKPICLVMNNSGEVWKNFCFIEDNLSSLNRKFNIISFGRGKSYENVLNIGFLEDRKELIKIFLIAHTFIFSSTLEPFGKVIFEAGFLGCNVFMPEMPWNEHLKGKYSWVNIHKKSKIINQINNSSSTQLKIPSPTEVTADLKNYNENVYKNFRLAISKL